MRAVDPAARVRAALRQHAPVLSGAAAWHVLGAGKASVSMLRAAFESVETTPASALCIAPWGVSGLPDGVHLCVGGHPVPSAGSVDAGARALALAEACGERDLLLVLLSGGASALMAAPASGIALGDKQGTTAQLLQRGADIRALNVVRKHLSRIKGGRLAAASRARTLCLVVSDVVGDDLSIIASGPTVPDPSTFADALDVLDRFGGRRLYPPAVVRHLAHGAATGEEELPKPGDSRLARVTTYVLAGRVDALRGAAAAAADLGYRVCVHDPAVTGEARDAAIAHAGVVRAALCGEPSPVCVVSAGETTVTVRGGGRGGRNQEFAVASLPWLADIGRPVVLVSAGTDGIDGPTDAAGAVADDTSAVRAAAAGLSAEATLRDNDAYTFFAALGDLLITGPSGTNVGDIQTVVVGPAP